MGGGGVTFEVQVRVRENCVPLSLAKGGGLREKTETVPNRKRCDHSSALRGQG